MSKFQYLMSQENIEARLEKLFRTRPEVIQSIVDMEKAHDINALDSPSNTLHFIEIKKILDSAKINAWDELKQEDSRINDLERAKELKDLENNAREAGRSDDANELDAAQKILDTKY